MTVKKRPGAARIEHSTLGLIILTIDIVTPLLSDGLAIGGRVDGGRVHYENWGVTVSSV